MLVNKNKTNKPKSKTKKTSEEEENLQSMRSWIRKIEQTTNSVSSRLLAVEKRLSIRKTNSTDNSETSFSIKKPIQKVFSELKGSNNNKEIIEVSNILDSEFERLQDELICQQSELDNTKEIIENVNGSIEEIKTDIKNIKEVESKILSDFKSRIEIIEKRAPPVMKLGKMEVPIEISGIVAGFIAIFAALFVAFDQTSLLVSPAFLSLVGCVFMGSAIFKAIKSKKQ